MFAQIAAEVLHTDVEDIHVVSMQDTDISPYDCGALLQGKPMPVAGAVVKAAENEKKRSIGFWKKKRCF